MYADPVPSDPALRAVAGVSQSKSSKRMTRNEDDAIGGRCNSGAATRIGHRGVGRGASRSVGGAGAQPEDHLGQRHGLRFSTSANPSCRHSGCSDHTATTTPAAARSRVESKSPNASDHLGLVFCFVTSSARPSYRIEVAECRKNARDHLGLVFFFGASSRGFLSAKNRCRDVMICASIRRYRTRSLLALTPPTTMTISTTRSCPGACLKSRVRLARLALAGRLGDVFPGPQP